jgi:SAM-dependent methyltransferase
MSDSPIDLMFGGMEKLGPGADADTLRVLHLLPQQSFKLVVDAGCGTGRQTLALAKELDTTIHALDTYEPFLNELQQREQRAKRANAEHLIRVHCLDMQDIPQEFRDIDLLWSEGAAYNIGFANALTSWKPALAAGGLVVVSELCWLKNRAPDAVTEFFRVCYPDMKSLEENEALAKRAGYNVLATHILPRQAWIDGYYDVLAPRAKALLQHSDPAVRDFAAETMKEIEVFESSAESYGYVFYVLN